MVVGCRCLLVRSTLERARKIDENDLTFSSCSTTERHRSVHTTIFTREDCCLLSGWKFFQVFTQQKFNSIFYFRFSSRKIIHLFSCGASRRFKRFRCKAMTHARPTFTIEPWTPAVRRTRARYCVTIRFNRIFPKKKNKVKSAIYIKSGRKPRKKVRTQDEKGKPGKTT